MFNRIFTKSALAVVLLGLGMTASAQEAQEPEAAQQGAVAMPVPGMPVAGYGVPVGPYGGGMPFGPYGGGMPFGPYGAGMPYGSYGYPGMGPMGGPWGGPMMGPGGFGPPSGMTGATPYQSIGEREREIEERLDRIDPSTQRRRAYFDQRRQERQEQFERRASQAGMPMMARPQSRTARRAPTGYGPAEEPSAPAAPSRSDVPSPQLEPYGRSMYPYGSSRRDYYRARRESRKEAFERQMQAAQARQPGMPGMPGMMPYGPMGMGGPGMARPDPWAPAPGEE